MKIGTDSSRTVLLQRIQLMLKLKLKPGLLTISEFRKFCCRFNCRYWCRGGRVVAVVVVFFVTIVVVI